MNDVDDLMEKTLRLSSHLMAQRVADMAWDPSDSVARTSEAPSEDEASGGDDLTGRTRYRNVSDGTPLHYAVNLAFCSCGQRLIDGHLADAMGLPPVVGPLPA